MMPEEESLNKFLRCSRTATNEPEFELELKLYGLDHGRAPKTPVSV